jgi:hypothetical protein
VPGQPLQSSYANRHRRYGKVLAACGMTLLQVQGGDTPGAYYSATWGA